MTENTDSNIVSRRNRRYYTYIEPVTTDPIVRGYFTLVASMLLVAFFIIFALSPTFSTIVGLNRKIEDQKKVIVDLDSKISSLIKAQETYSQVESQIPILMIAVPQKPSPDEVLLDVVKTATASGVTV